MNEAMQLHALSTWRMLLASAFLLWGIAPAEITAQSCEDYVVGDSYFGVNNYIEYRAGSLPIIVSVPHGGYLTPPEISDRDCANCTTVNDAYTLELGEALYNAILAISGCRPHLIINHLDRIKLDANRNISEGADGDPLAEGAWEDFHQYIEDAKACVEEEYGAGFYLDLHGHGHSIQRIEYGYLLYEDELAFSDATLNSPTYINYSSLRNLATTNIMGLSHVELLRGPFSLGSRLAENNYPGVPSGSDPYPLSGQAYFSGGYNTVRHSSYQGGSIDGVQVECNQSIRFDPEAREEFAMELAEQLLAFVNDFYPFESSGCTTSTQKELEGIPEQSIHPNPGSMFFRLPADALPCDLRVYRADGKLVYEGKLQSSSEVETSQLPSGLYHIHAWRGNDSRELKWTWIKQ